MNPTAGEISRYLWDVFGAGTRAVVFWMWRPRTIGHQGGEFGLVGLDDHPSDRVRGAKAVAETLARFPVLAEAKPLPHAVAIIYNREALQLDRIDGQLQHRETEAELSLLGCFEALYRAHIPVTFVDLHELESGAVNQYKILYLPYSYAMDDRALAAVRAYASKGSEEGQSSSFESSSTEAGAANRSRCR